MTIQEFTETINAWGRDQIPFLFLVDFEMQKPVAIRLADIDGEDISYDFNGFTNTTSRSSELKPQLVRHPVTLESFEKKFNFVMRHLAYGDSYLTNLTIRTQVDSLDDLRTLYGLSRAKYKLRFRDDFLCFSPETFVQIREQKIFSFPMKGTIDAAVPAAAEKILADTKELAEHVTIVDLIRNDLSEVSKNVNVKRFRYLEEVRTNDKKLIQVSSEIVGDLDAGYLARLGTILVRLLPAGSVSGAPKPKTLEIIKKAEGEQRGYYTGIAGIFDGRQLDSGVMIRFIEQRQSKLYYRSGGGITAQSILEKEYQEAIDKVYVPVD